MGGWEENRSAPSWSRKKATLPPSPSRRTSPPPTSTDRGTPLPPCISISSASPLPLPQRLTGSLPPLLARCQDLWGRCCRHDGIAGSVAAGFAFFQAATGSGEPRGRPPSSFSAARRALSLPVSLLLLLLAGPARERRPADCLGKKEEVKVAGDRDRKG